MVACQPNSAQESEAMTNKNKDFESVELNSDIQNDCSPEISNDSNFVGIAINAPTSVTFNPSKPAADGSFVVIPLCGYYQLDMAKLLEDAVIRLFAMNIETEEVYRGTLVDEEPGSEAPLPFDEPDLSPEDLEGQLLGAYFNPNFAAYVSLPIEQAKYKILVQIGETKSNVVDVELKIND